ncbi:MAG TPA: biotin/lipoyl-binding protein, partial [Rhodopila sp.]|nr:biotin/lipoyl-binding protein [Rhodopila sp.]
MSRRLGLGVLALPLLLALILALPPRGGRAQSPPQGVPVATATADVEDVPVYLYGLGTVQSLNTVQVKAQVNGALIALPVHEGQEVRQGDIIAEIDPRPYKA